LPEKIRKLLAKDLVARRPLNEAARRVDEELHESQIEKPYGPGFPGIAGLKNFLGLFLSAAFNANV